MQKIHRTEINEDESFYPQARLQSFKGEIVTPQTIQAISYRVFDCGTEVADGSLVVTECIFPTLQRDDSWTKDGIGYNFLGEIPGSAFPAGNKIYRVEIRVTPYQGNFLTLMYDVTTVEQRGS